MFTRYNFYLTLTLLITLLFSCRKAEKDDFSLTISEYRELGLPEYNKIWTQDDYIDAFIVLNKLKLTNPSGLPKKNSKKSDVYFDRMTSEENFSFIKADTLSLSEKAFEIQNYSSIINELIGLYTNVLTKDQFYHEELVELYIFGLDVTQKKLDVAHKIMSSDNTDDKRLQYGYYSVQLGYLEMVLYILDNQNASSSYSDIEHQRLSEKIAESISQNKVWMRPQDADRIKQKLQFVVNNTTSEKTRDIYQKLLDTW